MWEGVKLDASGSGYKLVMGYCQHINKPFGSTKGRGFLT